MNIIGSVIVLILIHTYYSFILKTIFISFHTFTEQIESTTQYNIFHFFVYIDFGMNERSANVLLQPFFSIHYSICSL